MDTHINYLLSSLMNYHWDTTVYKNNFIHHEIFQQNKSYKEHSISTLLMQITSSTTLLGHFVYITKWNTTVLITVFSFQIISVRVVVFFKQLKCIEHIIRKQQLKHTKWDLNTIV